MPQDIYNNWNACKAGADTEAAWNNRLASYCEDYPEQGAELKRRARGELPDGFIAAADDKYIGALQVKGDSIASRQASQNTLSTYGPHQHQDHCLTAQLASRLPAGIRRPPIDDRWTACLSLQFAGFYYAHKPD